MSEQQSSNSPTTASQPNINNATYEQLLDCPGMSSETTQAILSYKEQSGPISSIEQLENVPGLNSETIETLKQYFSVS